MALKEEIKKQCETMAIKTATAMTLLTSPMQMSTAYLQAESASSEQQIETAAPEQTESEKLPNPFSAEERADLHETLREGDENVEIVQTEMADKDEMTADVFNKLQTPVIEDLNKRNANEAFNVGNWNGNFREVYEIRAGCQDMSLPPEERLNYQKRRAEIAKDVAYLNTSRIQDVPEKADRLIDRSRLRTVYAEDSILSSFVLAHFSPDTQNVTMYKYLPHKQSKYLPQEQSKDAENLTEYIRGNPIMQSSVLFHENGHEDHWTYDGMGQLYQCSVNAAKGNRLTENVANTVEYLHAAHQYTLLKEQGIETLQISRDVLLSDVLKEYQNMDAENRPALGDYLRNAGIEQLRVPDEEGLYSILDDYEELSDENKPLLTDYLAAHGITELKTSTEQSIEETVNGFADWQKENAGSSFRDYIDALTKNGAQVTIACKSYPLANYFDDNGITDAVEAGKDLKELMDEKGLAKAEVEIFAVRPTAEMAETLNQPGKSSKEILRENHLVRDEEYHVFYDRPVEELMQGEPSVGERLAAGEDVSDILYDEDLEEAYVSTFEEQPIEEILEAFPGLKETVDEHGFDVNNPESVRHVVEASSGYWHDVRMEPYNQQAAGAANSGRCVFYSQSWSEQMNILENKDEVYQEVSERMMKDVYIGHNTTVDLTHCRDLLDTMSDEDAISLFGGDVSLAEMKEIDAYLTGKGLTTDEQKMRYMAEFLDNTAYRRGDNRDEELTKIMMSYCPEIKYQDGMTLRYDNKDEAFIYEVDGNNVDVTAGLFGKEETCTDNAAKEEQAFLSAEGLSNER